MYSLDNAKKNARNRNRALQKKYPLLAYAGVIDLWTPERVLSEVNASISTTEKRSLDFADSQERRTALLLDRLHQVMTPDDFGKMMVEVSGKVHLQRQEYFLMYLFENLRRVAPRQAQSLCLHDISGRHVFMGMDYPECPVCGKKLDSKKGLYHFIAYWHNGGAKFSTSLLLGAAKTILNATLRQGLTRVLVERRLPKGLVSDKEVEDAIFLSATENTQAVPSTEYYNRPIF